MADEPEQRKDLPPIPNLDDIFVSKKEADASRSEETKESAGSQPRSPTLRADKLSF